MFDHRLFIAMSSLEFFFSSALSCSRLFFSSLLSFSSLLRWDGSMFDPHCVPLRGQREEDEEEEERKNLKKEEEEEREVGASVLER